MYNNRIRNKLKKQQKKEQTNKNKTFTPKLNTYYVMRQFHNMSQSKISQAQ